MELLLGPLEDEDEDKGDEEVAAAVVTEVDRAGGDVDLEVRGTEGATGTGRISHGGGRSSQGGGITSNEGGKSPRDGGGAVMMGGEVMIYKGAVTCGEGAVACDKGTVVEGSDAETSGGEVAA